MTPPHREIKRYRRFQGWDYSRGASLFITLVTEPRQPAFGLIVDGKLKLTPLGEETLSSLEALPFYNPGLSLFGRVVMPDHIHFNCHIAAGLEEPLKFLGNAVRRLKNHISKVVREGGPSFARPSESEDVCAGQAASRDGRAALGLTAKFGWRQGYHDHLLPNEEKIASTERYIAYNVAKWELMKNRPEALRVIEPLDSPRLDRADYWKGVGNVALLEEENKIVSLRVSRQVKESQLEDVVMRMGSAINKGFTILSGFVSPGEKLVRDLCCCNKNAKFIRILPSMMPLNYKPESAYVEAFLENRYLEIAKGNEEVEFGRTACLEYNDEIVKIAKAGEGLAVYWRAEGLQRLG